MQEPEISNSQLMLWETHAAHSWAQTLWTVVASRKQSFWVVQEYALKGPTGDNNPGVGGER